MAEAFICMLCDKTEEKCNCERYCTLCMGQHNVRLCQDGQYYCIDCREACEFHAQV
jgi:hypothetical protein